MVVRILERQSVHHSSTKNGLRSRTLTETEHAGLSLRLEGCAVCKTTDDRASLSGRHCLQSLASFPCPGFEPASAVSAVRVAR